MIFELETHVRINLSFRWVNKKDISSVWELIEAEYGHTEFLIYWHENAMYTDDRLLWYTMIIDNYLTRIGKGDADNNQHILQWYDHYYVYKWLVYFTNINIDDFYHSWCLSF